jgi:hypothetical protein
MLHTAGCLKLNKGRPQRWRREGGGGRGNPRVCQATKRSHPLSNWPRNLPLYAPGLRNCFRRLSTSSFEGPVYLGGT